MRPLRTLPFLCSSRQYSQAWRLMLNDALEVHADHRVPVLLAHVEDHPVAQDAGVVDDDVELAEGVEGALDDALGALEVGDALAVGDGLAAHLLDLVDHLLGRAVVGAAGAVEVRAEVVDDDLGAVLGHQQRLFAADAAARAGDDRNLPFEQTCHVMPPPAVCRVWCGGARPALREERCNVPGTDEICPERRRQVKARGAASASTSASVGKASGGGAREGQIGERVEVVAGHAPRRRRPRRRTRCRPSGGRDRGSSNARRATAPSRTSSPVSSRSSRRAAARTSSSHST